MGIADFLFTVSVFQVQRGSMMLWISTQTLAPDVQVVNPGSVG